MFLRQFLFSMFFFRSMSISGVFGGENMDSMLRSEFYHLDVAAREKNKLGGGFHRLPLFSRCPITNEARLENPRVSKTC